MSRKQLFIVPDDPESVPSDLKVLLASLRELGLVGDEFDFCGETQYRQGPNFLNLVRFDSSHPIISLKHLNGQLVPVGTVDSRYECAISFDEMTPTPEFFGGGPCTIDPRCKECGYAEKGWPETLDDWYRRKSEHRWICHSCGHTQRVYELDWQDGAAFGRFGIIFHGIGYREAAPTMSLLHALFRTTGFPWKYFYYDDNPQGIRWD